MRIELVAFLIVAVAIAAAAWIWPRLLRRTHRQVRHSRHAPSTRPAASGPSLPTASGSGHEAARLRRELAERMNALRQARKPNKPETRRAASHDDDGPVIGFAETMIQEDSKA